MGLENLFAEKVEIASSPLSQLHDKKVSSYRMDILRSNSPRVKVCKLCQRKRSLAHFDGAGIGVSTVCIDCEKTLPPVPAGMRRCAICLQPHPTKHSYCKQCRKEYVNSRYNEEVRRDQNLWSNYRISLEDYNLMLFQQGGVCAICKQPETVIDPYTKKPKALGVDHNHQTGENRELLCHACNQLVGWIEKDREKTKKVLKYLKRHDQ